MNIKLQLPKLTHLRPRITVIGVGGAGSNAVNNMIASGLTGVNFVVANTDAQSLANSSAESRLQLGVALTEGLGAGARPEIGRAAAEESVEEIRAHVAGSHMVFVAAGMGGGTGTGAAAVIARIARECGALTVGVVTKPFLFEGTRRMRMAEAGVSALKPEVDTLIVIPNQNLFRIANERTSFADAFVLADQVLYSGIACVVDLIVNEGLINLDFADVRAVMSGMGTAMMGTGEAAGEKRAVIAAEEAISNPLLDDISLRGAKGLLVSITGNRDLTLYEVDEAATRVRQEVDPEANIIVGATFDDKLGDRIRVSIVASGMERMGEAAAADRPRRAEGIAAPSSAHQPQVTRDYYPPAYEASEAMPAGNGHGGYEPASASAASEQPPPTPSTYAAHDASNGRNLQDNSDLARALSEALGPRTGPERGYEAPPASGWVSQSGAVFGDAPPQLEPAPLSSLGSSTRAAPSEQSFAPQAPAEIRQSLRRLPEVGDFPVVAQREYHAKIGQYADPPAPPAPRAYSHPPPEPPRKLGFFERLTGARRKAAAKQAEQANDPHAAGGSASEREPQLPGGRGRASDSARKGAAKSSDPHDLPAFFGGDRK